jgi:hypothetical protein
MTLSGVIAPLRVWLSSTTSIDISSFGLSNQGLGDFLSLSGIDSSMADKIMASIVVVGILFFCFKDKEFRQSYRDIIVGIVIGGMVILGWYTLGILSYDEFDPLAPVSISFVAPSSNIIKYLTIYNATTYNTVVLFGMMTLLGMIIGSFIVSILTKSFVVEGFGGVSDVSRHFVGAALMGVGGVTSLGCTIGQGVSGVSTLSISSIIALMSIILGGIIGLKYMEEDSLIGAIKSLFVRG